MITKLHKVRRWYTSLEEHCNRIGTLSGTFSSPVEVDFPLEGKPGCLSREGEVCIFCESPLTTESGVVSVWVRKGRAVEV